MPTIDNYMTLSLSLTALEQYDGPAFQHCPWCGATRTSDNEEGDTSPRSGAAGVMRTMTEHETDKIVAGHNLTFWPAYKYLRNFYSIPRAAYYAHYFWRGYMIPVPAEGGGYFQINALEVPSAWCA